MIAYVGVYVFVFFFFQAEDGIRDLVRSRGLGDVYKRQLVLAPLLTVLAVSIGIIVSSRVNDPRAAEQLGSLVILPFMALFLGTLSGIILLNTTTFWITSALIALLDIGLVYVGVKLFQRETILTRWK